METPLLHYWVVVVEGVLGRDQEDRSVGDRRREAVRTAYQQWETPGSSRSATMEWGPSQFGSEEGDLDISKELWTELATLRGESE